MHPLPRPRARTHLLLQRLFWMIQSPPAQAFLNAMNPSPPSSLRFLHTTAGLEAKTSEALTGHGGLCLVKTAPVTVLRLS